jgi:hypothetical protein
MENLGALACLRARMRPFWPFLVVVTGVVLGGAGGRAFGEEPAVRVQQTLDVQGECFAPAGRDAAPVRQPITVTARFDFIERPAGGADSGPGKAQAIRRYRDAVADLRIDGKPARTTLGQDARVVHVALRGTAPAPYLPQACLTREEADLLDVPFDPLLLDRLRPSGPPAAGTNWTVAADAAAGLLAIDTIEKGELTGRITDLVDGRATLSVSGTIQGAVDGVPTRLVVEAVGTLPVREVAGTPANEPQADGSETEGSEDEASEDEASVDAGSAPAWEFVGAADRWDVTIRERRQASHVAPGFEVEARVAVSRRPAAAGQGADPAADRPAAAPIASRPVDGGPGRLWYREAAGGYDLVHDARWRLVEEGANGTVFRLVDRGALVAQCSITSLPRGDAAAAPAVAEVQRDVEQSLGGQFGRFVEATESVREDGTRVVRVVSAGRAGDLPFRWIHHLLIDPRGRRAAVAFMVEEPLVERFGGGDADLIAGLRFGPPAAAGTGEGEAAQPADREATLPRETGISR